MGERGNIILFQLKHIKMLKSLALYFMRTMYENNFFTELFFYIVIKNNLCKPFQFNVFILRQF